MKRVAEMPEQNKQISVVTYSSKNSQITKVRCQIEEHEIQLHTVGDRMVPLKKFTGCHGSE